MNRGGIETMLMNYYRNIDRTKIQFDFLEHRTEISDYDEEIQLLGGKIYRVSPLNPFSIKYRNELKKFFQSHDYKIVHSHLDCMSYIPLIYAKKAGIKVLIAHAHSTSQDKNLKFILKLLYKKKIKNVATQLFACGNDAGKWMFETNHFKVLRNAINTKDFVYNPLSSEKIKTQLGLTGKFVIGHVGRFTEAKNHNFIIEIMKEMIKINPNAHLVLVGTGKLQPIIKEKVDKYGLNNYVTFLGKCSNVNQIMQAFDIFLFPSRYEGLGIAAIEAQASGLKCFISNKVPSECIVTNNVTILSLDKTAQNWAEILNESVRFQRIDTSCQVKDSDFDIEKNAKWLEEFYKNEYRNYNK